MSNDSAKAASAGFPLASILTIIFVIAKLFGAVTWSWWWVFSPLWVSALLGLSILAIVAVIALLVAVLS
jgi:hypothetical protein